MRAQVTLDCSWALDFVYFFFPEDSLANRDKKNFFFFNVATFVVLISAVLLVVCGCGDLL